MIAKEKNKGGAPVKRRNVPSFSSGARISWADRLGWNAGGFRLETETETESKARGGKGTQSHAASDMITAGSK